MLQSVAQYVWSQLLQQDGAQQDQLKEFSWKSSQLSLQKNQKQDLTRTEKDTSIHTKRPDKHLKE